MSLDLNNIAELWLKLNIYFPRCKHVLEYDECDRSYWIKILTSDDPKTAKQMLYKFYEEFWLDYAPKCNGLGVTLEFVEEL